MQPRQLFSATLELNATAAGDTFTLVQAGDVVNLYHNQPTTGTPEATVPVADLSALVVNGVGTTTVNVDLSGGNPIPDTVSVDSGTVAFNQNLGAENNIVAVAIAGGATAKFNTAQHLDAVNIDFGGTFTIVVPQDGTFMGPVVPTAPDELSITSQLAGGDDTATPLIIVVSNATASNLRAAADRSEDEGGFDPFKGLGEAFSTVGEIASDLTGGGVRIVGAIVDGSGKVIRYIYEHVRIKDGKVELPLGPGVTPP